MSAQESNYVSEVVDERVRQRVKFGVQKHSPGVWGLILGEEVGELSRELLSLSFCEHPPLTKAYEEKMQHTRNRIFEEAVQVAAVALAIAQWVKDGEA